MIVSNWLKNTDKESTLEDNSELNDITNVKGEESYTQGSNGKLVWAADGNDIYYQGETSKELPVSVKMTYFLDGREISATDLAGKSGNTDQQKLVAQFFVNLNRRLISGKPHQQRVQAFFALLFPRIPIGICRAFAAQTR